MSKARSPYLALASRDFRRMWAALLVSQTGSQMQVVAINWHVYLLTRSPLALGFVGLTRVAPIIAFSLWGGIIADRFDRRWIMFWAQSAMTIVALGLAGLTVTGHETLWLLYLLSALSAAAIAFDSPSRQALVPRLVPREDLPGALSLNLTMFHATMIGGPALAGLLIAGGSGIAPGALRAADAAAHAGTAGLTRIYLLNALSFLAVLSALATLRAPTKVEAPDGGHDHPLVALRAGLGFVFKTPLMVWTMGLDFFATFFSGSMSLLPIFADQALGAGPRGYGLLAAAPALGAILGSLYTSIRPLPRRQGPVFLWAVAAYGFATIAFGLSRSYALAFASLAAIGLADLVSTVIRQTLRQLITPDELRGRMTSVNMLFFMGGPQLGEFEAGLLAKTVVWLGATTVAGVTVSVVSGGAATVLIAALVAALSPRVRRYDVRDHLAPKEYPSQPSV